MADLLPAAGQLQSWAGFLRSTHAAARRRHGPVATAAALTILACALLPAFAALAVLRRLRPSANLASDGLRFLLTTFPGSLLTRSHFTYEHLPPEGADTAGEDGFERIGRFVRALIDGTEDADVPWVDDDRGAPLDTSAVPRLLATTRRPAGSWDVLQRARASEHLIALRDGRMFQVEIGPRGARASGQRIAAALRSVMAEAGEHPPAPTVLTCWPRQAGWAARRRLRNDPVDGDSVRIIEGALLVVAIDDEDGGDPPARRDRNPANRWLDHTVQLVVTPSGAIEGLIDHAVIDGHDYGRLAERLRASEAGRTDDTDGEALPIAPLRWSGDPKTEAAQARARADLWIEAARFRPAVVNLPELSAEAARARSASPDAVCQLILHRAFYLSMGRAPAGQACVVHRRRHAGGRFAFADVATGSGDVWMTSGQGLVSAADALRAKVASTVSGPDPSSTLFALAGVQSVGPMGLRAWIRRLSDRGVLAIGPLATALHPELTSSNMSGLPALGQVGPVTQRPRGLACAHRIGPDGLRLDLWWAGAEVEQMQALTAAIRQAAGEAVADLGL